MKESKKERNWKLEIESEMWHLAFICQCVHIFKMLKANTNTTGTSAIANVTNAIANAEYECQYRMQQTPTFPLPQTSADKQLKTGAHSYYLLSTATATAMLRVRDASKSSPIHQFTNSPNTITYIHTYIHTLSGLVNLDVVRQLAGRQRSWQRIVCSQVHYKHWLDVTQIVPSDFTASC